jgi:hypothetical protein
MSAHDQAGPAGQDCPWQVCVEDHERVILGAGIMLDGELVVTCAHVVADTDGRPREIVRVRLDGADDRPARRVDAELVPGCFVPADSAAGRGDVALLRLRTPVAGQPLTFLRRTWLRGSQVRLYGYPDEAIHGIWTKAIIADRSLTHRQLVQLDVPPDCPRVEPGFSGSAVIDEGTGKIVGMIQSCERPPGRACWMVQVTEIFDQLPLVSRYVFVTRGRMSDPSQKRVSDAAQHDLLRELAAWLTSDGPGGTCVVTGGPGSDREALIGALIRPDGDSAVSQPGGIDIAVHAAGKTAEEVVRDLTEGLGGGAAARIDIAGVVSDLGSAVPVVVDEVDESEEPELLLDKLAGMMSQFPPPAVRLLLGFTGTAPDRMRNAVVAELPERPETFQVASWTRATADARARLAAATVLLDGLAAAEDDLCRRHDHVAPRITGTPQLGIPAAAALGVRLAVLRATGDRADSRWQSDLGTYERRLRDRRAEVIRAMAELDGLLARRDSFRAELKTYRGHAVDKGLDEDAGLSADYRLAHDLLSCAPCDLDRAEVAVRSYYYAINRRTRPK